LDHRFVMRFDWRHTPSPVHRLLLLLAFCAMVLVPMAHGQTTGALSGTVLDSTGAIIPDAQVTLINTASKAKRGTVANGQGFFTINAIQPAMYDLVITEKGFETFTITGIEIDPGDTRTIAKIAMKVGSVNQEVTVSATAAGVDLSSGEKSYMITANDITRLSTVGRDVTELLKMLPGFAVNTGGSLANGTTSSNEQVMGFGSSSVSNFSANGSTSQTGMTSVIADGANVMDPGDMGASITNVNMDMVQEVKVQTSNFGADSAKGPVVINAVGKSGGTQYHGSAYLIARNGALNANDWLNNYEKVARPAQQYYYPGANIGGPVRIPGTSFNRNKKMTFFMGFEYYDQNTFQQLLLSFVPTAKMLGGDLTPATIASALNVSPAQLLANCPNFYTSGQLTNSDGFCYSPGLSSTTYTQGDCLIAAGVIQSGPNNAPGCVPGTLPPVDPRAAIYAKFWPTPNRTPQAGNGLLSDGYNYDKALLATHNGFQYHARVDENFSDNTKLYGTYNLEHIDDEQPLDNTFYAGSDEIPYPTPMFSHSRANSLSLNFTHVFSPTLTNELIPAATYFYEPNQLANRSLVSDASTGWTGGRYYTNGNQQLPGLVDYEEGVPDFAMSYFPSNGQYLRKFSYDVADNLTKQLRNHSLKVGAYYEETANNQVPYGYSMGENSFNHYQYGCYTDSSLGGTPGAQLSQLYNNMSNLLAGCSDFTQTSNANPQDLYFRTLGFYATDQWQATKKLTLTYGLRFDHLGPWFDPHGIGLAVWNAPVEHFLFTNITSSATTWPGISWNKEDPSVPNSGAPTAFMFYSPRFGVSYDLYGDGKTVFRGGWGMYRFHDSYNDAAGALSTSSGTQEFQTPPNLSCTYAQIATAGAGGGGTPGVGCGEVIAPFDVMALDPRDREQPVTYSYSFTLDQSLPFRMNLEISYVGNQDHNLYTEGNSGSNIADDNQNYIPLGGLFQPDPITGAVTEAGSSEQLVQDYRPYPNYTTVNVPNHIAYGNYNSLQTSLSKQKGAFIFNVNYTWSKALGVRGDYRTGAVADPSNLRNNYGYEEFNRPQILNFVYSYQVGHAYHGNHIVQAFVNNWMISGITNFQSGPDTAVLDGSTNFALGGGISYTPPGSAQQTVTISNSDVLGTPDIQLQPVVTCNPKGGLHNSSFGRQYINGNCFALPKLGTNGAFELPNINGPSYFSSDLTLQRSFPMGGQKDLDFRVSGFNFLNHAEPQFFGPGGLIPNLNLLFGSPTTNSATTAAQAIASAVPTNAEFGYTPYKGGFRIVEFSIKYNF
jgi:outer membrane receptor protein involved in Fe transport